MKMRFLLISLLCFCSSDFAYGLENFESYRGIRVLGMGGAGVAVVNDETALAINPAGLGKLRNFFGTVFDPELEVNFNTQAAVLGGNTSALTDVDALSTFLQDNPDTYLYTRGQVFPSIVVRNFGLGVLYTQESYGQYDQTANTIDVLHRQDTSMLLGYSFRFWDGRVKLGLTGKYIQRQIVDEEDLDMTASPSLSTLSRSGTGLGVDAGLLLTAPWVGLPSLGVVVKDLGGTKFTSSDATAPSTQEQRIDVGLSVSPIHSRHLRSQWTVEYKRATSTDEATGASLGTMHYGAEFNFADFFFTRFGVYQSSWTAGWEFATEFFQFQLATYAVGTDAADSSSETDRRYAVKLGVRF